MVCLMLPAHFQDVTDDISRTGNQIWWSPKEIQGQSRNDKDTSTT